MDIFLSFAFIIGGFFLLIKGADWLVDGATSFAQRFGVSDLVIGLTIVSFGTSAPELLVNIVASFKGSADIAVGNIVGSNISNTLLILGATASVTPLAVQRSTVFKEIPFSLLAVLVLLVMANDHLLDGYATSQLSRGDGLVFMAFFLIFIYYTFGIRRSTGHELHTKTRVPIIVAGSMVLGGLVSLVIGGEFAVRGSIEIAQAFNISEQLIGLTIVALGTSLPELVTSIVAALKGKTYISVGNIIGSNIFNIFWILGISAAIRPLPFQADINTDLFVVAGSTVLLYIFIHTGQIHHKLFNLWRQREGHMLSSWEGGVMLALYVVYIGFVGWRG